MIKDKKIKKILALLIITIILISTIVITYAAPGAAEAAIKKKVDGWGAQLLSIGQVFIKWGGTLSFFGLGGYLLLTNDETGAKRAKWGVAIAFIAATLGWTADLLGAIFQ